MAYISIKDSTAIWLNFTSLPNWEDIKKLSGILVYGLNDIAETNLKNYKNSDYAINKFSEGIVYKFADGIVEISLDDYLRDNEDKTEKDFAELKALSDEIYYRQDRADSAQIRRNISINDIEDTSCFATRPLEEELIEINNGKYALQAMQELLIGSTLTEVQRRRFILHIFILTVKTNSSDRGN